MDFQGTRRVIKLLEEATTSSSALDQLNRPALNQVSQELLGKGEKGGDLLSVSLELLQAIQNLMRHHKGCFSTLDDAGITGLLSGLIGMIVKNLGNERWENDIPVLIESYTETLLAVADSEPQARSKVILSLLIHLFELMEHPALVFKSRIEVLKSVNILLEQCSVLTKEHFMNDSVNTEGILRFIEMISTVGDYEFQVCIIECLMRMFPRKARQKYAETFFQDRKIMEEFLMIRDKVFETDCRIFLNNVNARNDDPTKGVYSFPCISACIGSKQLSKPNDENYEEFWVDFNIGSMRLTLFCEQDGNLSQGSQMDEDMWETLEICKSNVKKYVISVEEGVVSLDINLKSSIRQLYPSQHHSEQGDNITVAFLLDLEDYISHAVNYTFNFDKQKKSKVSTVEFPIQISVKDQDFHDESLKKSREQHVNQACNSHDENSQGSQSKKRKVSVPRVPMKPISASPSTTHPQVNNQTKKTSETPKDMATPSKNPKLKVKVKTPVVQICDSVKKDKKSKAKSYEAKKKQKTKVKGGDIKDKDKSLQEDIIIPESQVFQDAELVDGDTNIPSDNVVKIQNDSAPTHNEQPQVDEPGLSETNQKETDIHDVDENTSKGKKKVSVPEDCPEKKTEKKRAKNESSSNKIEHVSEKVLQLDQGKKRDIHHQERSFENALKETDTTDDHFGFDDLGEVDRVPESLEMKHPDTNQTGDSGNKVTGNSELNLKNINVHDDDEVDAVESNPCKSNGNKTGKRQNAKNKKKARKAETKPSFTDVDNSLKELCDLDNKENSKEIKKNAVRDKKLSKPQETVEERRPLSQEEVDSIYTFNDLDAENAESVCLRVNKKKSKQGDSLVLGPTQKKSKGKSAKSMNGVQENTCVQDDDQQSRKENITTKSKVSKVTDKPESPNAVINKTDSKSRSLRARRQKTDYKEIDTDVESTNLDVPESNVYSSDSSKEEEITIKEDYVKMEKSKTLKIQYQNIQKRKYKDSNAKKPVEKNSQDDLPEGNIVTINSDESDCDVMEDTSMPEVQKCNSDQDDSIESEPDKYNESIGESLYVETDDSCNARSYNINYKDKKKRRSSLKKRGSIKSDDANKQTRTQSNTTKGNDKEHSKSVSFDDSVLKDISPIKKQTHVNLPAKKKEKAIECKDIKTNSIKNNKQKDKNRKVNKNNSSSTTISNKNIKNSPVQVSYSKSDSKNRPWSSLVQTASKPKPGTGYDPFDFDEQTENASNRSERLDRLDISKDLNKKYGSKSAKHSEKANKSKSNKVSSNNKSNEKSEKIKKSKTTIKTESHTKVESPDLCDNMFGNVNADNSPSLMVQDHTTKKWHRSHDYKKMRAKNEENDMVGRERYQTSTEVMNSSSPVHSEIDTSVDKKDTSEDGSLYIETSNTFENILKAIESSRHKIKNGVKATDSLRECAEACEMENDVSISPIQTPHLSSFSTSKISSTKRKHYTPLNINVVKTPQSVTHGGIVKAMLNQESDANLSTTDTEKDVNLLTSDEKSWIKSKLKPQRKRKTPVTYTHKRKERTTYYTEDSESNQGDSNDEVKEQTVSKTRGREHKQTLQNLKSHFVQLEDMMLASELNEDEAISVSMGSGIASMVQDMTSKLKSQQNLDDLILSPYTPIKSEHGRTNEENDISIIQTQENYSMRLSDQEGKESFNFYDSKYPKQNLLCDSGFQSGPSSAVRPSSTSSLKRKYPIKLIEGSDEEEEEEDISEGEADNYSFIPKKLFKFDPSVIEKTETYEDSHSSPTFTEGTSNFGGFNTGLSSFLNSFGGDIKRQMERKREQVDTFTKQAVKELHKHHNQNWVVQQQYRSNVDVEFKTKMLLELEELEKDIDMLKQAGQKTSEVYKYQLDVLHKNRNKQVSSLNNMKAMQSFLKEKSRKVDRHNRDLQNNLKDVWKKDIMSLQRKLIDQQQKEELMNAKRSLQRTFSTSMIW